LALLAKRPDGAPELAQRLAMRRSPLAARFGKDAEILYEDEIGFLDHTSWRGAFTDTV
jgi:hypothetical protein